MLDGVLKFEEFLSWEEWLALDQSWSFKIFSDGERTDADGQFLQHTLREWQGLQIDVLLRCFPDQASEIVSTAEIVCSKLDCMTGESWQWLPQVSYLRRASPDNPASTVGWHCDAEAVHDTFVFEHCVTVWLPLVPVGDTEPSLEFIVGSERHMREIRKEWQLVRDDLADSVPGRRWTPHLEPGDAMVFGHYVLHRTQPIKGTMRPSCELRFARP